VKVADVGLDLQGFDNSDIWLVDPVHPIEQVYRRIASGVYSRWRTTCVTMTAVATVIRGEWTDSMDRGQNSRRPREFYSITHS
jgi:hypothetical protein